MKKLGLLGVALVAALALTAIGAASAFAGTYDSEAETTELSGTNTTECANPKGEAVEESKRCKEGTKAEEEETWHTFKAGTVPVVCKMVSATVTQTGAKKEAKVFTKKEILGVVPVYTECTVAGQTATVDFATGECKYNFGEPTGAASPFTVATIGIACKAGGVVTITAKTAGCTIKVPTQTTTGTSTVKNIAGNGSTTREVTLSANVSSIEYTSSGGICGTAGTFKTGTYIGKLKVKGKSGGAQVGVFVTP